MKVHSSIEDCNLLVPTAWRHYQVKATLKKNQSVFTALQIWKFRLRICVRINLPLHGMFHFRDVSLFLSLFGFKVNILAYSCRRG